MADSNTAQPSFEAEVDQNEYLPEGGRTVDAILTVTATGGPVGGALTGVKTAQIIIVDISGSMAAPATKMTEAKKATQTAIDALPDGTPFAVIAGNGVATMVYPPKPGTVVADRRNREQAKQAVHLLWANGGTAIGRWLDLANFVFAGTKADIKHAILLTDGENQHETREQLEKVLDACEGKFICDARGVGHGWVAEELRLISSKLLGTADGLESPSELAAAFTAMAQAAQGKTVADVSLRLWTPANSVIRSVKQVFPQVEDLTARRTEVSARIGEYPTGAWGAEGRDYHITVDVEPDAVGEEVLAGRVSLVSNGQVLTEKLILAKWTDDEARSTKINKRVAAYTGQAELASVIQEGLKARDAGDEETATAKLGRAVQLAEETGHTDTAKLLARVVEVEDAKTGTVRLKRRTAEENTEIINVRSTKTVRVQRQKES
ncbi:VWA domain-containing protein [Catenuloplanes japonicus]|uniref:VWA domain-containing protein n=1 Tax=Catenuloplanes japonicus TaxID=33876 RepID=UPI000527F492|nr:VWA domain-containing protein [Catenuloplanes japonicus]